jgi:hypothetical protein
MRRYFLLVATILVSTSCVDSSGPGGGRPGLTLVSGYNLTDTIEAKPVKALVVEVRDDRGAIVPQGTVVRFSPVVSDFNSEMLVGSLTSTSFNIFAAAETDGAGRAAVLVQMGTVAGPARIAISVPTVGVEDTARYTVLPGQPSAILIAPLDTAMYVGGSYTIRGGVVDRWGNARTDPVAYTATPGVSVSSSRVVSASTIGRYAVTGTAGGLSATGRFSVVPQGTVAALVYRDDGFHIVTFNLDGSGFHDVVRVVDAGIGPRPRWIPGTNTIIYTEYFGGLQQLRTVDANGKVSPFFSSPPVTMMHQAEPSPSANAPVLYFSAYDSRCYGASAYCLFRSGIDGTNPELLGDRIAVADENPHPSASPDGSKVAFVMRGPQIKVFDYTTRTVSTWSVAGNYPAWSPDGTQIAYEDPSGGPLHLINPDGTSQRVITSDSGYYSDSRVAWSPDSKWLIGQNFANGSLDVIEVATGKVLPIMSGVGYGSVSWR